MIFFKKLSFIVFVFFTSLHSSPFRLSSRNLSGVLAKVVQNSSGSHLFAPEVFRHLSNSTKVRMYLNSDLPLDVTKQCLQLMMQNRTLVDFKAYCNAVDQKNFVETSAFATWALEKMEIQAFLDKQSLDLGRSCVLSRIIVMDDNLVFIGFFEMDEHGIYQEAGVIMKNPGLAEQCTGLISEIEEGKHLGK